MDYSCWSPKEEKMPFYWMRRFGSGEGMEDEEVENYNESLII
jgi:hypothetical protein